MKSKMSKACDIPMRIKKLVYERDDGKCIVCHVPGMPSCHYIPRSRGGLGIEQNVVTLCSKCHNDFDNGQYREQIGVVVREYLKEKYKNWNEEDLIYNKWKAFKIK